MLRYYNRKTQPGQPLFCLFPGIFSRYKNFTGKVLKKFESHAILTDNKFGGEVPFFVFVLCMLRTKKVLTYLVIAVLALLSALNYELFVFPNQFAPAGLNGLCTMFQHVTGLSMGYLNLLLNLPLAVAVYFKVSRSLSLRAMCYVLCFSAALLLLDHVDLSAFAYATESGTSTIMGPLVGGIISGTVQAALLPVHLPPAARSAVL